MASGHDLRKWQDSASIQDAFSALVSGGKIGYKTVIERKKDIPKCSDCKITLNGDEKFCPECGTKVGSSAPNPQIQAPTPVSSSAIQNF